MIEKIFPVAKSSKVACAVLACSLLLGCQRLQPTAGDKKPRAIKGEIDLRGHDISAPLPLQGEWEFYWKQLLEPSDFLNASRQPSYMAVPSSWSSGKIRHGYCTYRLRVRMDKTDGLLILFRQVTTSYKIWVDGKFVKEVGVVGDSTNYKPSRESSLVNLDPKSTEFDLIVQVANYRTSGSGIIQSPLLGKNDAVVAAFRNDSIFNVAVILVIFLLSVYSIANFVLYGSDISYLYLTAICWSIICRSIFYGYNNLLLLDAELAFRLEFFSVYILLLFFPLYVRSIFRSTRLDWLFKIFVVLGLVVPCFPVFAPYQVYRNLLDFAHVIFLIEFIYAGIILHSAYGANRREFNFFMAGLIVAFLLIGFEMFQNSVALTFRGKYLVESGILSFLFFQTLLLQGRHKNELVELSRINQEMDEFFYRMSHDFKTPIANIKGLVNLMELELPKNEFLVRIRNSNDRLASILSKLNIISENNKSEVLYHLVDVKQLIQRIFQELTTRMNKGAANLSYAGIEELVTDKSRMEEIFTQLISNSLTFSSDSVQIGVKVLMPKGRKIIIEISDNGDGMSPEVLKKAHTMFFRGSEKSNGAGLGLFVVNGMMQKLNGELKIESSEKSWTRITITIPYKDGRAVTSVRK